VGERWVNLDFRLRTVGEQYNHAGLQLSLDTVGKTEPDLWEPLEALRTMASVVASARDLEKLADEALGLALELTGGSLAFMAVGDAPHHIFSRAVGPEHAVPVEQIDRMVSEAKNTGGSVPPRASAESPSAFYGEQLKAGGKVLGVVGVTSPVPLGARQRKAFAIFAGQLASGLEISQLNERRQQMVDTLINLRADLDRSEKARLVSEERAQGALRLERAHELAVEALLAVSGEARTGHDLGQFYGRLTASVAELVGARRVLFWELNPERTLTAIPGAHGVDDEFLARLFPAPAEPYGDDLTSRVVYEGYIFRAARTDASSDHIPVLDMLGVESAISAPWRAGKQRLGVVAAYDSHRPEGFSEDDARVLQMIGLASGLVWQLKQAEGDLSVTIDRLQQVDTARQLLMKNLATAVDSTRKHFAGELHDDALQKLTAAELHLRRVEQSGPRGKASVDSAQALLQQAEDAVRKLLFEVQPPSMNAPGGFADTVRERAMIMHSLIGVEAEVEVEMDDDLPYEIKSMMFRQVAEALSNVEKHASATRVKVSIRTRDGGLHGEIVDDGAGFVVAEREHLPGHLGLMGLKERALLAGGWCEILSEPGAGTKVEFWFPLPA
jgi:signal transduction histidine kinase